VKQNQTANVITLDSSLVADVADYVAFKAGSVTLARFDMKRAALVYTKYGQRVADIIGLRDVADLSHDVRAAIVAQSAGALVNGASAWQIVTSQRVDDKRADATKRAAFLADEQAKREQSDERAFMAARKAERDALASAASKSEAKRASATAKRAAKQAERAAKQAEQNAPSA